MANGRLPRVAGARLRVPGLTRHPARTHVHCEINAFVNLTSVVDPPTMIALALPTPTLMSGHRSTGVQLMAETAIPTPGVGSVTS